MDPNAAADIATDTSRPWPERADHATALIGWLDRGGFEPRWPGKPSFGGNTAARLWVRQQCEAIVAEAASRARHPHRAGRVNPPSP